MNWKDESSYSSNDKERTPGTFRLYVGGMSIVVTRHIAHAPTDWLLTCEPWFHQKLIGTGTADEAKSAALVAVRKKLSLALDALK